MRINLFANMQEQSPHDFAQLAEMLARTIPEMGHEQSNSRTADALAVLVPRGTAALFEPDDERPHFVAAVGNDDFVEVSTGELLDFRPHQALIGSSVRETLDLEFRTWLRSLTERSGSGTERVTPATDLTTPHAVIEEASNWGLFDNRDPSDPPFYGFNEASNRVLRLGEEESERFDHGYVGTEHLVLGIIRDPGGVASKVLEREGVSLERMREQVEEVIGHGLSRRPQVVPPTPRLRKVFQLSIREALQRGDTSIGPEHILLGVIREGEGVAAQLIQRLGTSLPQLRDRLVEAMEQDDRPHRVDEIDEAGTRALDRSFESVERYIEQSLSDDSRPLDPSIEEQLQGYLQMFRGWHHTGDRDPVVYERMMAGIARLLPELYATDQVPVGAPAQEAAAFADAAESVLEAIDELGHEDEATDLEVLEDEVIPGLEAAVDALNELADAAEGTDNSVRIPESGELFPRVGAWADRTGERIGVTVESWGQRLGALNTNLQAAWARVPPRWRTRLLLGAGAAINWIAAFVSHAWPG